MTLELSTDLVQRWIADPSSNRGMLIQGDPESNGTSSQYRSSEFADPAFRPRVVLAFEKLR